MNNTLCKKCIFAESMDSDNPCSFDIPSIIQKSGRLENEDGFYKINNYTCRYGFSKEIYEKNIDKFSNIDMIEYVKTQNIVKYSMILLISNTSYNSEIIKKISTISILPEYITIICYQDGGLIQHDMLRYNPAIKYKIHNFLETVSYEKAIHIALETNKNKLSNLIWIIKDTSVSTYIENDSIQNINYLINVMQNPAFYYKSSKLNSQLDGVFINTDNYDTLSSNIEYKIYDDEKIIAEFYD
jgi:hypothetical protein